MYQSVKGKEFGYDSRAPIAYVHGVPIGIGPYPVRGRYIFVDSNVAGTDGMSPQSAVATIGAAHAKCNTTGNIGDTIVVMPGHTENISAAGGLTISSPGVSIIGLGYGSARPKITFTTANTATIVVTGAGCYMENLRFISNFLAVAVGIDVQAVDFWMRNGSFGNAAASKNFTSPIKATLATSNLCDGMRVEGCRWGTNTDVAGGPFISVAGTNTGYRIMDNWVVNPATTVAQLISVASGKLLIDADIGWNRLMNAMTSGELFISNDGTTNTGLIHNNFVGHADVTGTHDAGWDAGGFRLWNNVSSSVDNLSAFVLPAIDVNL